MNPAQPVLVVHPLTVDVDEVHAHVAARFAVCGWPAPRLLTTTVEDPGTDLTAGAVGAGADLVVVCGGDGTVRAVAVALAGSGVPLAMLPSGTGNLLARNLGIPRDLPEALEVVVGGIDRPLDLGSVNGQEFAVMAGVGLDAQMVQDAPPRLKKALGWPAYVLSGGRHLLDRRMRVRLRLDDGPWEQRQAHAVVVGNVGELQGGARLLPDADPYDGRLDVAVIGPAGLLGWLLVASRVLRGGRRQDARLERRQFHRLELTLDRPRPHEVDGDPEGDLTAMDVQVLPGRLVVRHPR